MWLSNRVNINDFHEATRKAVALFFALFQNR